MEVLMLSKDEMLKQINTRTVAVLFTFRPSASEVLAVLHKGKAIRTAYLAKCYESSLSKATRMALDMLHVTVKTSPHEVWGRRCDIHGNYITIEEESGDKGEKKTSVKFSCKPGMDEAPARLGYD
jgi:hypothetical protein